MMIKLAAFCSAIAMTLASPAYAFTATTQNVRSYPLMPQSHVRHDIRLTASQSDLVFWQEIRPLRYKQAVRNLGPKWRNVELWKSSEPISYRRDIWAFIDAGRMRLYPRDCHICGGKHDVTWVKLRNRNTGAIAIFNSTHYLAHGWSTKLRWAASKPARRKMWYAGRAKQIALIKGWLAAGDTVIGGGDFNRFGGPFGSAIVGHPVHYRPLGNRHIDWLFTINANKHQFVHIIASATLNHRYSDHRGQRMTVQVGVRSP